MKISVIVPIYNREAFIPQAISCLKAQDASDIEFLLVNDGSTDTSGQLLEQLCPPHDTRFRIFHKENGGYGHSCNFGMRHATGDFIAIYEPDDCITPDFYSTLADAAARYQQADIIRYNGIYCQNHGKILPLYHWKRQYTGSILDRYTMKRFWRSHPSVFNGLYRTSFLRHKAVHFCETPGASFQDVMFMVSLFYANPSIAIIDDTKYTYVLHPGQSIQDINSKIDAVIMAWDIEYQWLCEHGFYDHVFYLYRVFTQLHSLVQKSAPAKQQKLLQAFKRLSKGKIWLGGSVPTFIEKFRYAIHIMFSKIARI